MKEKIKIQKGFIQIPLLIIIIVSVVIVSGVGYGTIEYRRISKTLRESGQLTKEEKYNEAVHQLELIQNRWLIKNLSIKKQEISNKIKENENLLEDKLKYNQGLDELNQENWQKAIDLLSKISDTSFYYQKTQTKIEEAKRKIAEKELVEKRAEVELIKTKDEEIKKETGNVRLNFIENLSLNTPIELIKEKLGAPYRIYKVKNGKLLMYDLDGFTLKVGTKDDEAIESLSYLLYDKNKKISIISSDANPSLILGKNTFGDYKFYCSKITLENSSKDIRLYCDCYFGNPGNYWYYRIGNFNDYFPSSSDYQEDKNGLIDNKYFQNIKINFVSIARDEENLTIIWYGDFI